MKPFLFSLIGYLFFSTCYCQTEVLPDSISDVKPFQSSDSIRIRCSSTVTNQKSPLFIIDGVVFTENSNAFHAIDPNDIVSINVLKGSDAMGCYGSAANNGVVLIETNVNIEKPCQEHPFKVYKLLNENWTMPQDMYNAIRSRVPNVSITTNSDQYGVPNIRMRGDDNTIVIVDGVRYDASILNTLNPSDIESVTVAPNAAAANYLRTN